MHILYTSIFEWLEVAKPYLNDIAQNPHESFSLEGCPVAAGWPFLCLA